jgi:cytochrome b
LSILEKLRFYHAALALSASAAYATGELGFIHAWLGYLVAGIIVMRLLWGIVGPRQIGISRFIPDFSDVTSARLLDHPVVSRILISGIALSLVVVSATGIAMDRFSSLGSTHRVEVVAPHGSPRGELVGARTAMAHSSVFVAAREEAEDENEREDWIKELHEASANLMLALVVLHVTYLLLFKRKLAFFMLFRSSPRSSGVSAPNQA